MKGRNLFQGKIVTKYSKYTNHPLKNNYNMPISVKGTQIFTNKEHLILEKETVYSFLLS